MSVAAPPPFVAPRTVRILKYSLHTLGLYQFQWRNSIYFDLKLTISRLYLLSSATEKSINRIAPVPITDLGTGLLNVGAAGGARHFGGVPIAIILG